MKTTINFRYLLRLLLILGVFATVVYFVHRRQVGNLAQVYLKQADAAEKNRDWPNTVSYLTRYLVFKPGDVDARERLGLAMLSSAKSGTDRMNAYLVIDQVIRDDPKRESLRRKNIRNAMDPSLQLYQEAMGHLTILIKTNPKDSELHDLLGQCLVATGDYKKAVDSFDEAIKLKPSSIQTYGRLAFVYQRHLDLPDKAEETIQDLVEKNPQTAGAYLIRANYRLFQTEPEKAQADIQVAQKIAPNDAEVLLLAGNFAMEKAERLRQDGKPEESKQANQTARQFYEQGIEKNPPPETVVDASDEIQTENRSKRTILAKLYQNIILLDIRMAQLPEAVKYAKAAIEALPDHSELLLDFADVLIRQEKYEDARVQLKKLREIGFELSVLDYYEAQILTKENLWLAASNILERVTGEGKLLDRSGFAQQAFYLLGQCYDQMGEFDLRTEAFTRSRPSNPRDQLWLPASYALAASYTETERISDAITVYSSMIPFDRSATIPLVRLELLQLLRKPADKRADGWDSIEKLLDRTPDTFEAILVRMEVQIVRGKLDDARLTLNRAKEKHGAEIDYYLANALLTSLEKKPEESQQILKNCETTFGDRVEIRLAKARFMKAPVTPKMKMELDQLGQDINKFSLSDRQRLLSRLARKADELGIAELSSSFLERQTAEQPDNLGVQFKRFDIAVTNNDETTIRKILAEIRRIDGSKGTSTRGVEALYLIWKAQHGDKGGLDRARENLLDIAESRRGWTRPIVSLGVVYELQGKPDEAFEQYRKAVDMGDKGIELILRLVDMYYERGRINDAAALLKDIPEELLPQDKFFLVADVFMKSKDTSTQLKQRALERAENAVKEDPKNAKKQLLLGRFRWLSGQRTEAEACFQKAVELEGESPVYWISLIDYMVRMNRRPEGEKLLVTAKDRVNAEEKTLMMAQATEILGQNADAEKWYQAALVRQPENILVLRAAANFRLKMVKSPKEDLPRVQELLDRILQLRVKSREDLEFTRRILVMMLFVNPDYESSRLALEKLGFFEGSALGANATTDELRTQAMLLVVQPRKKAAEESVRLFEEIDARNQLSPDDQFLLSQIYNKLEFREKAKRGLQKLLETTKETPSPLYIAYYINFMLKYDANNPDMEKWLAELDKLQPDTMLAVELRARHLMKSMKTKESLELLVQFAKRKKEMAYNVAQILEEFKEFNQAEKLYLQAVQESKNRIAPGIMVEFYTRQNQHQKALDLLERDQKIFPPLTLSQLALNILYSLDQPSPEMIGRVEKLLEQNKPTGSQLFNVKAALCNLRKDYSGALKANLRAIELDEKNLVAMNNYAFLLAYYDKNYPEALQWIQKAQTPGKKEPTFIDTEAMILIADAKPRQAIDLLEAAVYQSPSSARYYHLALAYHLVQQPGDAKDAWKKAKELGLSKIKIHPLEYQGYDDLMKEFR